MAGPAIVAATATTHWTIIPTFAALPWAVRAAIVPPPEQMLQRLAHIAGGVFAILSQPEA